MTVADEPRTHTAARPASARHPLSWWGLGLANLGVILVLSLVTWWVVVDPQWSVFGLYPQPFTALLFWMLMGTVWVGFTFEWLGPASLRQPWRGLVGMALTIAIGVGITLLLAYGWGAVDPSFSAAREGGAGFATGNLFVLFGFFFYVLSASCHGHWPWSTTTRQPWTGFGQLTLVLVPTLVAYLVFVLPNLAVWAVPGTALLSLPTLIGWFYSLVVSTILTSLLAENRPWSLAGRPVAVVIAALVGNAVLGTVIYFVVLPVAKLLMGPENAAALGAGVTLHAAELGVCWAFWMIAWANIFGNKPTRFGLGRGVTVRVVVTFALACVTYLLYYFVLAQHVLHEPVAAGTLYGDALGFIDWAILWMLWYVLFLGSYGLPKADVEAGTADPEPREHSA